MSTKLKYNYKIWIETEDGKGVMGYGQVRLLRILDQAGSLKEAVDRTGLNFKKSCLKVKEIESILGIRIIKTINKDGKRVVALTGEGKILLESIEKFMNKNEKYFKSECEEASAALNRSIISANRQ